MTINLTPQESEEYFYNALCNGLGELSCYGLQIDHWENEDDYKEAKQRLDSKQQNEQVCYEDVLMEILRHGQHTIWILDDNDEEQYPITLQLIHERVQKTPLKHLMDMINEHDDAITADVILQTVIYGDIIYG